MILSEVEGAVAGDAIYVVKDEATAKAIVDKTEDLAVFESYTSSNDSNILSEVNEVSMNSTFILPGFAQFLTKAIVF